MKTPQQPRSRLRAQRSRVRTGCSTCKVRHLKCDETKPVCFKCSSTGRSCNVYSNSDPRSSINLGLLRGKEERRYFDLFQNNTVLSLIGFDHVSGFWSYSVLQSSQSSPAVLHAVLALSMLHEHLAGGQEDKRSYQLFLQQYNKAISHMRYRQSDQETSFILTCCVLFISIENAQGNHDTALTHLRNGLSILDHWRTNAPKDASEAESITQVFRQLDLQATVFLDSRQPELTSTSAGSKPIPDVFNDMIEAKTSLEEIELRLFYSLTTKSVHRHSEQSRYEMLSSRASLLRGMSSAFSQWKTAWDAFILSNLKSGKMQTKDLQLSILLELHHQTASTMLDMRLHLTPSTAMLTLWDNEFTRINELSRSLIHSCSSGNKFVFGTANIGVIAPLYYVAMNATGFLVRQQALGLLREVKWTEGFWEAQTAANIAENVYVSRVTQSGLPVNGGVQFLAHAYCILDFEVTIGA